MPEVAEVFERFFEKVVPEMFEAVTEVFPVAGMEDTVFKLQVNLTGEGETTYGITIRDAREIEVTKGGIEDPMLTVELPSSIFINTMKMAVTSPMHDLYDAARDVEGTVVVEPLQGDGRPPLSVKLILNQSEEPNIKLSADIPTFMKLMNGEESPPMAFMQGNLKIEGNLPFGMELMSKFYSFMPGAS